MLCFFSEGFISLKQMLQTFSLGNILKVLYLINDFFDIIFKYIIINILKLYDKHQNV